MRLRPASNLAFAALFIGSAAGATGPEAGRDPASADKLFREGRALAATHDYAHACPKFAESLGLDPAAGTLLNLADCEEQIGHLAGAWEHFKELGDELPTTDARKEIAVERARILERRLPRLTIELSFDTSSEATVRRDDVDLARSSLGVALPVDPGDHGVLLSQPGHTPRRVTFALAEGQSRVVIMGPGGVIPLEGVAQVAGVRPTSHGARRTGGWIVGGVGLAALATGAYFGVRALEKRSDSDAHCNNGACTDAASVEAYEDAKGYARVADVGIGIGIVAVAVAGYLLLTSSEAEAPTATPPAPRLALDLRPVGLRLRW